MHSFFPMSAVRTAAAATPGHRDAPPQSPPDARRLSVASSDASVGSEDLLMESRPNTPFDEAMRHARPLVSTQGAPASAPLATAGPAGAIVEAARRCSGKRPADGPMWALPAASAGGRRLGAQWAAPLPFPPVHGLHDAGSESAPLPCRMPPLTALSLSYAPAPILSFSPRVTVTPEDWSGSDSALTTPPTPAAAQGCPADARDEAVKRAAQ